MSSRQDEKDEVYYTSRRSIRQVDGASVSATKTIRRDGSRTVTRAITDPLTHRVHVETKFYPPRGQNSHTASTISVDGKVEMEALASSTTNTREVFPPQDRTPNSAIPEEKDKKEAPTEDLDLCTDPGQLSSSRPMTASTGTPPASHSHSLSSWPFADVDDGTYVHREGQYNAVSVENGILGSSESRPGAFAVAGIGQSATTPSSLAGSNREDAATEDDATSVFVIPNAQRVDGNTEQQLIEQIEQLQQQLREQAAHSSVDRDNERLVHEINQLVQQLQEVPQALPDSAVIAEPMPPSSTREVPLAMPSLADNAGPAKGPYLACHKLRSDRKAVLAFLVLGGIVGVLTAIIIALAATGQFNKGNTSTTPSPISQTTISQVPTQTSTEAAATGLSSPPPSTPASAPAQPFTTSEPSDMRYCEAAMLIDSNGSAGDYFGEFVAVSGGTAVIGAWGNDDNGPSSGSVHVFIRAGSAWTHQDKLLPGNGAAEDLFGDSVAIDGDTIAVGASGQEVAYVFFRNDSMWTEQAMLVPSNRSIDGIFGKAIGIFDHTIIVGAPEGWNQEPGRGKAYIFVRVGQVWSQHAELDPSDSASNEALFGSKVAIHENTALVGAFLDDANGSESGSVFVYVRVGTQWMLQAKLMAQDGSAGDQFGRSIAILNNTVIVGAWADDSQGQDSGSAYVFTRTGSIWTQVAKLLPEDGAAGDQFGISAAFLSEDVAIIGANGNDDNGSHSGSVYIFERTANETWKQQSKVLPSDGQSDDEFGVSVAADRGTAVVGTFSDYDGGEKAYVLEQC